MRLRILIKTLIMNKTLHISTALDKPGLLEDMVEKLVSLRADNGITDLMMPRGLEAIDTSSTEAYASGNIEFDYNEKEKIRMPFITSFLFTCTRNKKEPYDLNWSMSLS